MSVAVGRSVCQICHKKLEEIKVVMNGAGAAGIAIAKHLLNKSGEVITL